MGRLAPEKRIAMLRPVIYALPGARLAIVGDGPARWMLERQFAGLPARFTGYLQGPELAAVYASADIFVLTGAKDSSQNKCRACHAWARGADVTLIS